MRARAALFVALAVLIAGGLWWTLAGSPRGEVDPAVEVVQHDSAGGAEQKATVEVEEETPPLVSTVEPEAERVQVAEGEHGVFGHVSDADGAPLEGAEVSLTAWTPELAKYDDAWMVIPDEVVEGATVRTRTSAAGLFHFASMPEGAGAVPLILWVTHGEHLADSRVFTAEDLLGAEQEDLDVRLEAGAPVRCRVLREGAPAGGAQVIQRAHRVASTIYPRVPDLPNAEWAFLRSAETDDSGMAQLAPARHSLEVRASLGEEVSTPWQGPARPLIELELVPTFVVEGLAVVDGGRDDSWGRLHVELLSRFGSMRESLKRLIVRDDGGFGPERVPVNSFGEAVARFAGGDLVPSETVFATPAAGERVYLELHASAGNTVYLAGYDPEEQVIMDARAFVQWNDRGMIETREYPTDEEGLIWVPGVPDGIVRATVRAEGFQDTVIEPFAVPEDPPIAHAAVMPRARVLRGRCLFEGKPVEDFQVFAWSRRRPYLRTQLEVWGSKDGSFECRTAPTDAMGVLAYAPGKGVSRDVNVGQSADADVELELLAGRRVRGRVLDAQGGPLADVHVAPALPDKPQEYQEIGPGVETGPDGVFELSGVSQSHARIRFERNGFGEKVVVVEEAKEPFVDLGDVSLVSSQPLSIHVELPPGEGQGTITTFDTTRVPILKLPPEGDVRFDSFRAGTHTFVVRANELGYGQNVDVTLVPGEPWNLEFDLRSGPDLTVRYVGEEELGESLIFINHNDSKGRWVTTVVSLGERRQAHVFGVQPGPVQVELEDRATGETAYSHFNLEPDELARVVEIGMSGRTAKLQVRDAAGHPVAGIDLYMQIIGMPSALTFESTDADGMARFSGLEPGPFYACAKGLGGGQAMWAFDVPADEEQVVELVFDPSHELAIRFVEEGQAYQGLTGGLWFEMGGLNFGSIETSDTDGRMVFDKLGLGRYVVTVTGPDILPFEVHAEAGAGERVQEVYSLTDATLRVIHEDGSAAAGVRVELLHQGLDLALASGLSDGWLVSSTGKLVTGQEGKLTLKGLPRGEYTWEAEGGSGTCVIERDAAAAVVLMIP